MLNGVLGTLHAGREVHYQPPAWQPNGRTGHIDVAAGASTVIVEGVGASRRQLANLVDEEEIPFLVDDRPWERADFIVATAPILAHDPGSEVVLAPPLRDAPLPASDPGQLKAQ